MRLTEREQERLMVTFAADVAQRRRSRGLRLNHPEAVAVITAFVLEGARDGRPVADLMSAGREVLTSDDVLPGVPDMLESVQVEATFPDGTKLVTVHDPIPSAGGVDPDRVIPGEILAAEGTIELSPGRPRVTLRVVNAGDRPVQVGSHYHFAAVNPGLEFDRAAARGFRLDIPAGTSVRFEPGISRTSPSSRWPVADWCPGCAPNTQEPSMTELSRARYAALYGPTVGDRVRLADTDLLISPTEDRCGGPIPDRNGVFLAGEEAVFGGGKVIRESMGQGMATRADGAPDLVITGALVLDHWGVIKADIGILDGRIVALGKAGNPDTMDGVTPSLVIGPSTEVIAGNGLILTAGGIDSHVHLIAPQQVPVALSAGMTTLIGGGTGPADGTKATTVTASSFYLEAMALALTTWPVNTLLLGKGNTVSSESLWEQLRAGAAAFKLHEDWGTTPAAIDACLSVAQDSGVQVAIHTDTLNEAGFLESTLAAIAGRPIHTYHTEGAGGGHAPDIIRVASHPNVLPSSTNPTRPFTRNTLDEHLDMLMVCHHLDPTLAEDLAFAESRIRPSTMAAEDILHDMGAISMIGSDSQAMGRIGETIIRTWQTAHVMKGRRGSLPGDGADDNHRARRYIAKYTIGPAVTHGIADEIGSVEPGKLADLVLWEPAFFGVRPHLVIKAGMIAWAAMGDANASIPTPQPQLPRPMFGAYAPMAARLGRHFVSAVALEAGFADRWTSERPVLATSDVSRLRKTDLPENGALPTIDVDPETFAVHIDGELVEEHPVDELPLTQRYHLF